MTPAAAAPARGGRREARKAANREAILAAAMEVFAELGYDAASVRDVIRRTELASGTFYNYFPDKEAVFRALIDRSAREVRVRLVAARAAATSLEGFVEEGYRAWFSFIVEDPTMFRLLRRNSGTIRTLLGDPILGAGVDELQEDLRRRGDLGGVDTEYLAGAMAGAGFEIAVRMIERDPPDVDGAVRFATRLFLAGIGR